MAIGDPPSGPSIDSSYLYRMQQAQGQGGNGAAPILMGARLETNVGSPLSLQGKLFNADKMAPTIVGQRRNGPVAGLLQQMGLVGPQILEGLKQVAQAAPVQQASIEQIQGPNIPRSFAGSGNGTDFGINS